MSDELRQKRIDAGAARLQVVMRRRPHGMKNADYAEIAALVHDAMREEEPWFEAGSLERTDNRAYDLRQRLDRAIRWLREAEDIARCEMPERPTADRIRSIYEQITDDVLNGRTTIPPILERLREAEMLLGEAKEAIDHAPHAGHCDALAEIWPGPCTCWKAKFYERTESAGVTMKPSELQEMAAELARQASYAAVPLPTDGYEDSGERRMAYQDVILALIGGLSYEGVCKWMAGRATLKDAVADAEKLRG